MNRWKLIPIASLIVLAISCGFQPGTQVRVVPASEDVADTLAENSVLLFQWVNTLYVKAEFDYTIDDQETKHVELPPRSVINLRLTGQCPEAVTFNNIEFGDEFAAGTIPFVRDNYATEGDLAAEGGDFIPASFFCYTAWQMAIQDSQITVAGLDRQANSMDEGESDIRELLESTSTTGSQDEPTGGTPRQVPETDDEPDSGSTLSGPRSSDDNGGTGRIGSVR